MNNTKLEELFNLPPADELNSTAEEPQEESQQLPVLEATLSLADKIDKALPEVKDMETADTDLDNYAEIAEGAFKDLMDLGRNMDDRNSGKIFEVASSMLKNAIDAKNTKLEKKLRMIELQLKKAKFDADQNKANGNEPGVIDGQTMVMDRNALLAQLVSTVQKSNK